MNDAEGYPLAIGDLVVATSPGFMSRAVVVDFTEQRVRIRCIEHVDDPEKDTYGVEPWKANRVVKIGRAPERLKDSEDEEPAEIAAPPEAIPAIPE